MKVLKARAGVLTNLEVFEHLKELQVEIDQVSECRRFNISRQIWRQQGKKGVNLDVPTYEDDIEGEMYRLQRQRDKLVADHMRATEEKRKIKQEAIDKENDKILEKWEEQNKQANANKKRGQKKTTLPKPVLRELSPEPDSTPSAIDTSDQPKTTEEAVEEARKSVLSREQFFAVRPMTDALRFVTSSTLKYLGDPNYMVTYRQTPELVRDLMQALTAYNLTKAETLQIVNCPPLSIVELWLSMEELDERFPDSQQHTELLDLIARHLLPVNSEEADPDAYVAPEGGAGHGGQANYYDDEEEMAHAAPDNQFFAEDKWGREGLEEVEGRDIDEE